MLYLHGNAGNITYLWPDLRMLTNRMHVSVLAFDYRGYGRSEGRPSESGLLADARAARSWLAERAGIAEAGDCLVWPFARRRRSSRSGGKRRCQRRLVLESTFASLPAVANDLLPLSPGLLMINRFNSIKKLGDYAGPLLIAHGDADELIPFAQGERLFAAANQPKRFVRIAGGDHNWVPPEHYIAELDRFLCGDRRNELTSPQFESFSLG